MYYFYLDGVLLPIAPSSLKMSIKDKDVEIDLANGGTMSVLNYPGLTTYSFTFRAPTKRYPFAVYTRDNAGYEKGAAFLTLLENLKTSREPFYFEVYHGETYVKGRDINLKVSLVEYGVTEDAEEAGDYIIDVELKQYIPYQNVKTVNGVVVDDKGEDKVIYEETVERDIIEIEKETDYIQGTNDYIVKEGDTFQSIAEWRFESMSYAEAIAIHNNLEYTTEELDYLVGIPINLDEEAIKQIAKELDEKAAEKQKDEWWDGALMGATAGAAMGATVASVVPGLGTVVGGILGGVGGAVVGFIGDLLS